MNNKSVGTRVQPGTFLLAMGIGAVLIGAQWLVHLKYEALQEQGKPAIATVTADKSFFFDISRRGKGEHIKRGDIQYVVDGQRYEKTIGFHAVHAVGEQIAVQYAPENPKKVADAQRVQNETISAFLERSGAGLFILLFGIVGYGTTKKE